MTRRTQGQPTTWHLRLPLVMRCSACLAVMGLPRPVALQPQPPVIVSFSINDSSATVHSTDAALYLAHTLAGTKPGEYRVSARADFASALWLPYTKPLHLTGWQGLIQHGAKCDGRMEGQRLQLFFQVRAGLGGTVHIVNGKRVVLAQEVESNVVSDAICVVGER